MCSIDTFGGIKEWVIGKETLLQVYPLLFKKYEVGGKFTFPANAKTGEIKRRTSHKKIHTVKGGKDSVNAPLGILNFHTHPISCYLQEDTVWGWPSGEDVRESILFGLRGSFAHAIPSVEGVYIFQTNPCVLRSLSNMESIVSESSFRDCRHSVKIVEMILQRIYKYVENIASRDSSDDFIRYIKSKKISKGELVDRVAGRDQTFLTDIVCDVLRGIIVVLVEIYFRSTHGFRTHRVNKNNKITPEDFIKFVESFQLGNIFNHKKIVKGCGNKLKCNGIPIYSKGTIKSSPFKKYLREYEDDTGFYIVDKYGSIFFVDFKVTDIYDILPNIEKIAKKIMKCDQWFSLSITHNNIFVKNMYVPYVSLDTETKKKTLQYYVSNYDSYLKKNILPIVPQGDSIFHYFSIHGNCSYNDIKNHLHVHVKSPLHAHDYSKPLKIHIVGSRKCPYTVRADKLLASKKIPFTTDYYQTIAEALEICGTKTIPAIYNYGKLIGGYDDLENIISRIDNQINN